MWEGGGTGNENSVAFQGRSQLSCGSLLVKTAQFWELVKHDMTAQFPGYGVSRSRWNFNENYIIFRSGEEASRGIS